VCLNIFWPGIQEVKEAAYLDYHVGFVEEAAKLAQQVVTQPCAVSRDDLQTHAVVIVAAACLWMTSLFLRQLHAIKTISTKIDAAIAQCSGGAAA
jgi:hypothetical protein